MAIALAGFGDLAGLRQALIPSAAKHRFGCRYKARRRRQRLQEVRKRAFDPVALDRLPVPVTALAEAHVVRMAGASLAGGPAGGQRLAAMGASDRAT